MKNPYEYDRTALPLRSQATQRLMCRAWEEGNVACKAEQAEIVSELVEALEGLIGRYWHNKGRPPSFP